MIMMHTTATTKLRRASSNRAWCTWQLTQIVASCCCCRHIGELRPVRLWRRLLDSSHLGQRPADLLRTVDLRWRDDVDWQLVAEVHVLLLVLLL